jgi:adenosylcobinamide amidohydrolase
MKIKRLIIYPKDIMLITGKSERYSRYLHKRIKKHFKKEDHQALSVTEFCNYMGLDSNEIQEVMI